MKYRNRIHFCFVIESLFILQGRGCGDTRSRFRTMTLYYFVYLSCNIIIHHFFLNHASRKTFGGRDGGREANGSVPPLPYPVLNQARLKSEKGHVILFPFPRLFHYNRCATHPLFNTCSEKSPDRYLFNTIYSDRNCIPCLRSKSGGVAA